MEIGQPRRFSRTERIKISLVSWIGYWAIALIGRSLRWQATGFEHLEEIQKTGRRAIFTCWHGRIFPATWRWRHRGIVVMTSLNLDGEIIAACIRRLGYGAARGSSSRAGGRALAQMVQEIRSNHDVGFTIDGPRGPRYVAKAGPIILARKTGAGIFCFHIALKRKIQLSSWDHFQIPMPFSQAMLFAAPALWIPPDADASAVRDWQVRMQSVLDELRTRGEAWEQEGKVT